MAKKIRKIQIIRHIVQLILFFLLPGIYIMAFSELKNIFQMIIRGNFNFIQAFPQLLEFSICILFTIFAGRFFCGWFCAFGTFNDWVHITSKRIFKINFKISENLDSKLKYVKYVVLLLLLIAGYNSGSNFLQGTSPWDAFAQITDFSKVISTLTIGFVLLVLITLGDVFIERFFCRYLCPLGAVFSLFSKISIFKISKPNDKCGKCRVCTNNCSMGLKLYGTNSVHGGECINCLKCIEVCPRKNTSVNIIGENVDSKLACSIALTLFIGTYGLVNLGNTMLSRQNASSINNTATTQTMVQESASNNNTSTSSSNTVQGKYKDGTYTGTGTGFRGGTTKVSVTIKNGKITDTQTVSTEDTPRFYQNVESTLPSEIISTQSTSVDAVSGATYSSKGFTDAVQNALNQAVEK
ncbi:putative electron transport protein YccM [Clostridium ragsdalei P11]|uniref:Putative electron transport protein YccM n=1 Tax=Clostridium ragsdalei P11 TaxID=1353534 RepID=A0A1A6AMV6_9CLOT|nr:4Fe-4S binding protein [Clostridium ragsdalei]OBR91402.1 putative electron transport protein YccM [Clostridium ragsdalei P11]